MNIPVRVTFNLQEEDFAMWKELSMKKCKTMTDVLCNAVLTYKYLIDETEQGNKIVVEDKDNRFRQLD